MIHTYRNIKYTYNTHTTHIEHTYRNIKHTYNHIKHTYNTHKTHAHPHTHLYILIGASGT